MNTGIDHTLTSLRKSSKTLIMNKIHLTINILFLFSIAIYFWDTFYMEKTVNNTSFSKELGDADSINFGSYGLYYQYYQLDTFENRYSLKKELKDCLLDTTIMFEHDGLLTVRFSINKAGKADRFRYTFIDSNYKEVVSKAGISSVSKITRCLKNKKTWHKGTSDGKPRNYSTFLNVRIQNGRIHDLF